MPYLDYAASAPLRAEALAAMLPLLERPAANPSSQHGPGRAARAAVDLARGGGAELHVVHATPVPVAVDAAADKLTRGDRKRSNGRKAPKKRAARSALRPNASCPNAPWRSAGTSSR